MSKRACPPVALRKVYALQISNDGVDWFYADSNVASTDPDDVLWPPTREGLRDGYYAWAATAEWFRVVSRLVTEPEVEQ